MNGNTYVPPGHFENDYAQGTAEPGRAYSEKPKANMSKEESDQLRDKKKAGKITTFIDQVIQKNAAIFSGSGQEGFFNSLKTLLINISPAEQHRIEEAIKTLRPHPGTVTDSSLMLDFILQLAGVSTAKQNSHWRQVRDKAPVTQAVQWMKNNSKETQLSFALTHENNLSSQEQALVIAMMTRLGFQYQKSGQVHFVVNSQIPAPSELDIPVLQLPTSHRGVEGSIDQSWIAGAVHAIGEFTGLPVFAVERLKSKVSADSKLVALIATADESSWC